MVEKKQPIQSLEIFLDVSSNPEDVEKALNISRIIQSRISKKVERGEIIFKDFNGYWKTD